ncbi:MAG TPA: helix-turn-helix domain-containing protein [Microvirga sp.]|nr:helix-turn-helix domain-containing protein [Microvirga sp.]
MQLIPTYSLYGESKDGSQADWVHCETIQARSRLHNYEIQPHRHENLFQILHLAGGRAEVVVDGKRSILEGPSIVAIPAMAVHGYTFSADVEGTVLTLFENRLAHVLKAMGGIESTFRQVQFASLADHPDVARSVAADVAALAAEFDGRAHGRLGAIEARLALVLVALHRLKDLPAETSPGRSERALQHALRFRQLVDREFRTHKPIEEYARRLGLTPAHLNRVCREQLGDSALGVVHERMVLEAKRYLTFTSMSAKEIALALAFEDPSYFTRFFKKKTGIPPVAYRALQRGT